MDIEPPFVVGTALLCGCGPDVFNAFSLLGVAGDYLFQALDVILEPIIQHLGAGDLAAGSALKAIRRLAFFGPLRR